MLRKIIHAALLVVAVAFALLAGALVWASDDDRDSSGAATATSGSTSTSGAMSGATSTTSVGSTTLNAGDVSIGGSTNKSYAFAHGLGDVDINEGRNCMGSEQWGTFIVSRQTLELNPWCASLFYELNGKHLFAAKMRCDIKEVRKHYENAEDCWFDQEMVTIEEVLTTAVVEITETDDEEDWHDLIQQEIDEVKASLAAQNRQHQSVRSAQREVQQVQQQQQEELKYTEEQRAEVAKILGMEDF